MFARTFKKRGTSKGKGPESLPSTPAAVDLTDIALDEALLAIDSQLRGLAEIGVAQAAKERSWATLHRELERHPIRPAASALPKGAATRPVLNGSSVRTAPAGHSRGWRVAIGSMAAAVVAIAVLGSYAAGLFTTTATNTSLTLAESTEGTQPPTSVSSSDTVSTPGSTSTETVVTEVTTTATTTRTVTTNSTQSTTPTSKGPVVTNNAPTTQPQQNGTTTTNEQQMADAQLENSAMGAAQALGRAVVDRFASGDLSGARSLVDSGAEAGLTWMISSLDAPTDPSVDVSATKVISKDTVRITLQFVDGDKTPRFFIKVRVTPGSAIVTDISRGL